MSGEERIVGLNVLVERAVGVDDWNPDIFFNTQLCDQLLADPYWIWCHYHAPIKQAKEERTPLEIWQTEQDRKRMTAWLEELAPDATLIDSVIGPDAVRETLEAMFRGDPVIRGGVLASVTDQIVGRADLLVRCDDVGSQLGDYHYRVGLVRGSRRVQPETRLEGSALAVALGTIQGFQPVSFDVVLRRREAEIDVDHETLERCLGLWQQIRDDEAKPEAMGYGQTASPWRAFVDAELIEQGDLTLIPGVGPGARASFAQKGIRSLRDLHSMSMDGAVERLGETAIDYYLYAKAYLARRPIVPPGRRLEIPRRKRSAYIDVKVTSAEHEAVSRPYTFMIGILDDSGYRQWTARREEDEGQMWEDALDWLGDLSDICLYAWGRKVDKKIHLAILNHLHLTERLLQFGQAVVNLRACLRQTAYLPVPRYDLGEVAGLAGVPGVPDDQDDAFAMVEYWSYLEQGDVELLDSIALCNREDLVAVQAVHRWLENRAQVMDECLREAS
jgi:uncharacterized protein